MQESEYLNTLHIFSTLNFVNFISNINFKIFNILNNKRT